MAEEPAVESRPEERPARGLDLSSWLVTLVWGLGAFIYGWLLAGVRYGREYWNLSIAALGWADWGLALFCGLVAGGLSLGVSWASKSRKGESRQLFRIVVAVLPALFVVSALAVLTLTLATYNGDWVEARQGIATAFAALIAAVGVVVSVAVSYKSGEENRLAQQKNLETQLKHQETLEEEKGAREQQKLDAELIKNLNDRLHEVIARRYSSGDDKDTSGLVSASYFQLASLYKDWETLSKTSDLISLQKESQQRNILKLLFGVYQESNEKGASDEKGISGEKNSSERSEVDIRTLNSVIQDIFPRFEEGADNESKTPDGQQGTFDLSYLDLRGLDLGRRDLRGANLIGARLERAYLVGAHLERAYLWDAHLEGAYLVGADLEGAGLQGADLEGAQLVGANLEEADLEGARLERAYLAAANLEEADLEGARLERAYLWDAHLEGANLMDARLDKASFFDEFEENPQNPEVRGRIINQLKASEMLPAEDELLKAEGFDQALVDQIIQAHKRRAGRQGRVG